MKLAQMRKTAVAVLGGAALVATTIPQESPMWRYAQIIIAVATAAGVYGIRNAPAAPAPPPPTTVTRPR